MRSDAPPVMIDAPMPIRTPRLLIRPKQPGDGEASVSAITETWDDLHQWMAWAERLDEFTVERQEARIRQQMAAFLLREEFNLLGVESCSGEPVIWCGLHDIDWKARQCATGFWVRKSAQRRGFATEATNALLRYAFDALGMHRVGITHSYGNEASRKVVEGLGFAPEGVQRSANRLPAGRFADKHLYARFNVAGLPSLDVSWGSSNSTD
jgi:RimJ/RimL family protein N-acetyltransferase